MRKLFTLLTLLVAIVTGAWGETVTVGRTAAFSADTHANTLLPTDNSDLTVTIADGTQSMGANEANKSTKDICYKSTDKVKIDAFLCYRTYINNAGLGSFNENAYAGFKVEIAEGKYLELSQISGKVATADDGTVCRIIVEDDNGTALQTSSDKTVDRDSGNDFTVTSSLKLTGTVYVKMHYWTTKKSGDAPHPSKYIVPVELSITGNLKASTAPIISTTPKSINLQATESGEAVNNSFTIIGSNLTDGTYNLNIPSVTGLSVLPTSFTVLNGSVNQTVEVSYSSTENVPANTANITATVNELNLSVAVNYSASVTSWTLQTINTSKTWDFSTLSGGVQYSGDDLDVEHVYANIADITCPAGFDGTALAFTGQFPLREGKGSAQNGTLKFKTSVPGYIVVKFSDTGTGASSSAVKRYLVVNGETTDYWASREKTGDGAYAAQLNVTTNPIAVPAGDVTISGTSALVYTKVEFTPTAEPADPTTGGNETYLTTSDNMAGWRAFYDASQGYTLDNNTTAYVATAKNGSTVTMTALEGGVPAGTPVILKTTSSADNYKMTLTKANVNPYVGTNLLTWETSAVSDKYRLGFGAEGVGFYPYSGTPASGAVILDTSGGAKAMTFVFIDPTGISSVSAKKAVSTGKRYNLAGQLVGEGYKGIVIENGKKFNQ